MNRPDIHGRGQALHGDRTTSGALLISTLQQHARADSRGIVRKGDPTTTCPKCGKPGVVVEGDPRNRWMGELAAVDGHIVSCGCPYGSNRIIAPLGALSSGSPVSDTETPAVTNPRSNTYHEKRVTQLYWSYSDDFIRISGPSRHYVDLNLHVETENYQAGEKINVTFEYSDGDNLTNDLEQISLNGSINHQGVVIFRNAFKGITLNLK